VSPPDLCLPGSPPDLSTREFEALRALVAAHTGIALGPHKRAFLQARLGRRLRGLGLTTFAAYHRALSAGAGGDELVRFVNAVTTTKTDFFREPHHFAHLAEQWAPSVSDWPRARLARIWSVGCSTGEEPYSIAMALADASGPARDCRASILASDINTDALARASAGIYPVERVQAIPGACLRRHFLRGTGPGHGSVRVRPELRARVTFRRIGILDPAWPTQSPFDVVFCRNVLIYFDRPTQQRVLTRLVDVLRDGGLLMLGHSEGVHGTIGGLRHLGHTIYRKEHDHGGPDSDR